MWRGWILWFGNLLACREVFLVDALGFCRNLRHGKRGDGVDPDSNPLIYFAVPAEGFTLSRIRDPWPRLHLARLT
jgi:hypothetical protein